MPHHSLEAPRHEAVANVVDVLAVPRRVPLFKPTFHPPFKERLFSMSAVPLQPRTSAPALVTDPGPTDDRLHTLDILRGLALFGMILVHFHQKMRIEVTGPEDLIGWGVWILVEKAWGTFAFLFGVGFAVLLRRLEACYPERAVILNEVKDPSTRWRDPSLRPG